MLFSMRADSIPPTGHSRHEAAYMRVLAELMLRVAVASARTTRPKRSSLPKLLARHS